MKQATKQVVTSNVLLLLIACIWGTAFVAQEVGVSYIGPLFFNGIRFLLGTLFLLPLLIIRKKKLQFSIKKYIPGGLVLGAVLFIAATLQQVGIVDVHTTAGKAGFITGLYVILVPIFAYFLKHRIAWNVWPSALLAVVGLYVLSIINSFTLGWGDLLVLLSAVFWAVHIIVIDRLSPEMDSIALAAIQFAVCGMLSILSALFLEPFSIIYVKNALIPLLYSGLLSIGIAYTLQVVVQKRAKPFQVSIILSSESLFAVLGGWLIIGETLSETQIIGCVLMLSGMILSQIHIQTHRKTTFYTR